MDISTRVVANRLLAEVGLSPPMDGAEAASAARDAALSDNTRRNYEQQYRYFQAWCEERGLTSMPPAPETIGNYLAYRADPGAGEKAWSIATIELAKAGIAARWRVWRDEQLERGRPVEVDPCDSTVVRDTMRGLKRQYGRPPSQAAPLTEDVLAAIRATSPRPRIGRGGRPETAQYAEWRSRREMALVHLLADAALRRSEVVALRWRDIIRRDDGIGVVFIAHSKTDQENAGAFVVIRKSVLLLLERTRAPDYTEGEFVFTNDPKGEKGLDPQTVNKIVKAAVKAAGLPNWNDFSGHSGRVGYSHTSRKYRAPMTALMAHGRWKSANAAARYGREFADDEALQYLGDEFLNVQPELPDLSGEDGGEP